MTSTRPLGGLWALLLPLVLAGCGPEAEDAPPAPRLAVATQVPAGRQDLRPEPDARYPVGSRIVRLDLGRPDVAPVVLTEGLAAAGGPVPTLDGEEILFTAKETIDAPYGIWSCRLDGGDRRLLISGSEDCGRPAELPDGNIVYARVLGAPTPTTLTHARWALFVWRRDVLESKRITFGGGIDVDPTVLPDGRVLYSAWQRAGSGPGGLFLWTVSPDGTGAQRLSRADAPPGHRAVLPRPASEGRVFYTNAETGRDHVLDLRAGCTSRELAYDAVPFVEVAPRPRPQGHLSSLRRGYTRGDLLCLDARPPEHTDAARIRVTALPRSYEGDPRAAGQMLGEVPLATDGSFFVSLPADTPVLLDLLDERGRVLVEGATPLWVRPNETRACVGCHDDPDTAPPNRRPLAIDHDPFLLMGGFGEGWDR